MFEQINKEKNFEFNKISFTPNRDPEWKIDMHEPIVWKGFPLWDRFWYSLCCKGRKGNNLSKQFLLNEMLQNPSVIDPHVELASRCLSLTILRSGTLEIEPTIVHPYVQISIINLKTGRFLQKANFDVPAVLTKEKNLIVSQNRIQKAMEYKESPLDCIPPLATGPFDLREKGESFAEWNEEIIINDEASNLLSSENIFLFEIMDFNLFPTNKDEVINKIAWGYLKPVGYSRTYMGRYKIQLYKYKYKRPSISKNETASTQYLRTPDILFEFNWIEKEKYQTFLEIEIKTELKPTYEDMSKNYFAKRFGNSVFAPEGQDFDKEIFRVAMEKEKQLRYDEHDHHAHIKRLDLLRRKKGLTENCILPNKLLFKFSTAKLGCLTHEFSNDGRYIAAACTDISSLTTIKIFNVEDGVLKYHFKGHHELIHHIQWSFDNLMLITSSSDTHVTFWRVPKDESSNVENLEHMDNDKMFKICSIPHPSYVYSTSVLPDRNSEMMLIATACADGVVRIYAINFNFLNNRYNLIKYTLLKEINISQEMERVDYREIHLDPQQIMGQENVNLLQKTALDHRHPNCLLFEENGRLLIGDSLGAIHIWTMQIHRGKPICNKIKIITHKELEGDAINKIIIEHSDKKRLIVHSRDNCIRLIDISRDKPRVILRYFGLVCSKTNLKSTISPDGGYILSGSEEGRPFMWSMESGILLDTSMFECKFYDFVSDVSWNNSYNMIAMSGFGQEYPLLVYVYEKENVSIDPNELKLKGNTKDEPVFVLPGLAQGQDNTSDFVKEYKSLIEPNIKNEN